MLQQRKPEINSARGKWKKDRQKQKRAAESKSFNPVACVVCEGSGRSKEGEKRKREGANTIRVRQRVICVLSLSVYVVKMDSSMPQGLPTESCKNSSPLFLTSPTIPHSALEPSHLTRSSSSLFYLTSALLHFIFLNLWFNPVLWLHGQTWAALGPPLPVRRTQSSEKARRVCDDVI